MSKALLMIDFIKENVCIEGKMAKKGYPDYCQKHNVLKNAQKLLSKFRENNDLVIHVKIGFSSDYREQPKQSPLFGAANKFQAFQLDNFGCEFCDDLVPIDSETIIIKHRVSAFFGTPLEILLKNNNITDLYICGVATDLAVQSAARDAHDRDFIVHVVEDCCGAANESDHTTSLVPLRKIAHITTLNELC